MLSKKIALFVVVFISQLAQGEQFKKTYQIQNSTALHQIVCDPIIDSEYINTYYCTFIQTRYQKYLTTFTDLIYEALIKDAKRILFVRSKILLDPDPELLQLLSAKNRDPRLNQASDLINQFLNEKDNRLAIDAFRKLLLIKDDFCFIDHTASFFLAEKIDAQTYSSTSFDLYKYEFTANDLRKKYSQGSQEQDLYAKSILNPPTPNKCKILVW